MRISDWSSDVCSSDLSQSLVDNGKATRDRVLRAEAEHLDAVQQLDAARVRAAQAQRLLNLLRAEPDDTPLHLPQPEDLRLPTHAEPTPRRSEEHTSELQSLMRISYAVFCLKKKRNTK